VDGSIIHDIRTTGGGATVAVGGILVGGIVGILVRGIVGILVGGIVGILVGGIGVGGKKVSVSVGVGVAVGLMVKVELGEGVNVLFGVFVRVGTDSIGVAVEIMVGVIDGKMFANISKRAGLGSLALPSEIQVS
jgi:hypothetical protein